MGDVTLAIARGGIRDAAGSDWRPPPWGRRHPGLAAPNGSLRMGARVYDERHFAGSNGAPPEAGQYPPDVVPAVPNRWRRSEVCCPGCRLSASTRWRSCRNPFGQRRHPGRPSPAQWPGEQSPGARGRMRREADRRPACGGAEDARACLLPGGPYGRCPGSRDVLSGQKRPGATTRRGLTLTVATISMRLGAFRRVGTLPRTPDMRGGQNPPWSSSSARGAGGGNAAQ